jgi:la-related protein 1
MYLRRHMDSQGFVSLEFIADFNRIKSLSTDLEVIKFVCQQSGVIEYRIGEDGQDRLRRREGWAQWVLNMAERDATAQNEGPKELHQPPVPRPMGLEQLTSSQWTSVPSTAPYGNNGGYSQMNGDYSVPQDLASNATAMENSGTAAEDTHDAAVSNGHPIENSTKAVSPEPDLFSDAQLESLTVIVRKQDQSRPSAIPLFASRTFSNGSIDSKHGAPIELENMITCQPRVNGIHTCDM